MLDEIDEHGSVPSAIGKLKFLGPPTLKSYLDSQSRPKQERIRNAILSDGSKVVSFTAWGDHIDILRENQLIQFCDLNCKMVNDELKFSTNYTSNFCFLTEDLEIDLDSYQTAEEDPQIKVSDSICCPIVEGVRLSSFLACKCCKGKLTIVAGSGLYNCAKCSRGFSVGSVDRDPSTKKFAAYLDVTTKDEKPLSLTIHTETLYDFFGDQNENSLRLSLVNLENVDFVIDKKMTVSQLSKHQDT